MTRLLAGLSAALALGAVGCSELHSAALRGQTEIVRRELDKGADVNGRFGAVKFTPLMAAAGAGSPETVKLLLDRGANAKLAASNGKTALDWVDYHWARVPTQQEKEAVIALLVAAGCRYMDGRVPPVAAMKPAQAPAAAPPPAAETPQTSTGTAKAWWETK